MKNNNNSNKFVGGYPLFITKFSTWVIAYKYDSTVQYYRVQSDVITMYVQSEHRDVTSRHNTRVFKGDGRVL